MAVDAYQYRQSMLQEDESCMRLNGGR